MQPTIQRSSLKALAIAFLSFSGVAFAAPVSPHGHALSRREDCEYGDRLTVKDYVEYLQEYYTDTGKYVLYSGGSKDQAVNFVGLNTDYKFYDDFYDSTRSEHYLTKWPQDENGCYRPDDADASSEAIGTVATGDIRVFGGVEWQEKGARSWFATKEVPAIRTSINAGTLSKMLHMVGGATGPDDVLAEENGAGDITFVNGHNEGETNATGTFGDCSSTEDAPTCDNPSQGE
jgi:hypothetical protein